ADAANCEFVQLIEGTVPIEESLLAVPLRYGSRVVGVIVVSKLGLDQFDEDDVRLLEVLAGHAAVAVENARLYESARREAESATALLGFGRELATAPSLDEILQKVVVVTASLLGTPRTSVWLEDEAGWVVPRALHGHTDEERVRVEARRFDVEDAKAIVGVTEPFVLGPTQYARIVADPLDPNAAYAIAPLAVAGRVGCIVAEIGRASCRERVGSLVGAVGLKAGSRTV